MTRSSIPERGRPQDAVLEELSRFQADDIDWRGGRTWSLLYSVNEAHHDLLERASSLYMSTNGLNPMAFKSLKRLESEVVQMTASMLNAPPEAAGTMTSGGTESILLAVKAARDRARRKRPWIRRPEVALPQTAHVAFDKAAHCFGVRLRRVPTDEDGAVDPARFERALGRNTILVVGSAPQYPHGQIDPIPALGAMALRRRIPMHVDACFGGFILPWLERLGMAMPSWDFRVPGVTSMSADAHKYGYGAKGASVILYRSVELLQHQFFVTTDWPGGIYASPTLAGTRPGGPIAAAWASMQAMGEDGYLSLAREALQVTQRLRAGIEAIDGLRPMGTLQSTVVTWTADADDVDVYAVADQLADRGWSVGRQQRPASVHCTVNASNAEAVEPYLRDLRAAVEHARAHPELGRQGEAAMYGMMAKVPVRALVERSVREFLAGLYGPQGQDADLGALGEGKDDGPLLRLLARHRDRTLDALDRLDALRRRARRR